MPTNTAISRALVGGLVPPDLNCPRDGQAIVDLVVAIVTVAEAINEASGGTSDSVAQQALQQAGIALSAAQQALAAIPQTRSSGEPISIPTGDSAFAISWSPAMPDTNYEVRCVYFGADVAVAVFYAYRVVDGSRTTNGCVIRLDNTPANTKISWVVQQLT